MDESTNDPRINIPIARKLRERLKARAARDGKTIKQVVNELISAHVAPVKKAKE